MTALELLTRLIGPYDTKLADLHGLLTQFVVEMEALHRPMEVTRYCDGTTPCSVCVGEYVPWPCETIQLLRKYVKEA